MLDSPNRLTALCLSAGLLAAAGFAAAYLRSVHGSRPVLGACFCLLGSLSMYRAAYKLREGVRTERWPASTVAAIKSVIDHPAWKVVMAVLCLAMFVALIDWHGRNNLYWSFFILLQTQTQISGAFSRPREESGWGARVDWSTAQPLISDHWGER